MRPLRWGMVGGIECVSIVTPNATHAAASLAFIAKGIDVICDKPMATSLAEALAVEHATAEHGVLFALTHNYSAYPMVQEARHLVQAGELGALERQSATMRRACFQIAIGFIAFTAWTNDAGNPIVRHRALQRQPRAIRPSKPTAPESCPHAQFA